jgi:hypothetical protein
MSNLTDGEAALIDEIRRELTNDFPPDSLLKFEVAVARVIAARIAQKRREKRKNCRQND